jgi:hypothetical protein
MQDQAYLRKMQRYVAEVAITPSALRNLGAKGLVSRAQNFLAAIDLKTLSAIGPSAYSGWLNQKTEDLLKEWAVGDLWRPARKSVNIFMVMASLNRFLCAAYALDRLEDAFEVPLDNYVAKTVLARAKKKGLSHDELPRWLAIKQLDPKTSEKLQEFAAAMAKEWEIPRGRLDVVI